MSLSIAHAGWFSDLCTKALSTLVQDDPYQFETTPAEWLEREASRLVIADRWRQLSYDEETLLRLVTMELERRKEFAKRYP